jgi:integrase
LLQILGASPDGQWFFPGERDPSRPFRSFTHGKEALDRRTNTAPWRIHDLRHTAQTIMEEIGVLPHVVDQVLNHKTPGMRGRYGHHNWIEEKKDALTRLATAVFDIVNH